MSWASTSLPAFGHRLGGADEAVDRHDAGGDLRLEVGHVAVARQDHVVSPQLAALGA
jgi:hypothetical protein